MRRFQFLAWTFVATVVLALASVDAALATTSQPPRIDKVLINTGTLEIVGANFGSSPTVTFAGEPFVVIQVEIDRILVARPDLQLPAGSYTLRVQAQPPHPALAPLFRVAVEITFDAEGGTVRVDRLEAGELSAATASIGPNPEGPNALIVFGSIATQDSLSVAGSIAARNIVAQESLLSQGDLSVARDMAAQRNVTAGGNVSVGGNVVAQNDVTAGRNVTALFDVFVGRLLRAENDAQVRGNLSVSGTISGHLATPSDSQLKRDIEPLAGGLEKVRALRGVRFAWRDSASGTEPEVGLIAQEVEAVLPEAVRVTPSGAKGVYWTSLSAVMIEAIKEQQATIDRQRAQIEALVARFTAIEKLIGVVNR